MEAIKISLNDYVLSGGGFNGESYDSKTDPTVMLKLYFPDGDVPCFRYYHRLGVGKHLVGQLLSVESEGDLVA